MADKMADVLAKCNDIIKNSPDCAAEVDLLLGALARHPDWTEREILEMHRRLVLDFADQLCEHS